MLERNYQNVSCLNSNEDLKQNIKITNAKTDAYILMYKTSQFWTSLVVHAKLLSCVCLRRHGQ